MSGSMIGEGQRAGEAAHSLSYAVGQHSGSLCELLSSFGTNDRWAKTSVDPPV